MKLLNTVVKIVSATFILVPDRFQAQQLSMQSLLNEMVDRDQITNFPNTEYATKQYSNSSYERAFTAHRNQKWFANLDRTNFFRIEQNDVRRQFVLLDANGAGVFIRCWMTFAGLGQGRVF